MILAELAQEAGVPDGVLQVVHGAHDTVNGILDAPQVRCISFVGGDNAGKYIHKRGTEQGKRVQSNMAAKNHCVSIAPYQFSLPFSKALSGGSCGL